jgi:hypothetical protein
MSVSNALMKRILIKKINTDMEQDNAKEEIKDEQKNQAINNESR